jgi:hypothetical protein
MRIVRENAIQLKGKRKRKKEKERRKKSQAKQKIQRAAKIFDKVTQRDGSAKMKKLTIFRTRDT